MQGGKHFMRLKGNSPCIWVRSWPTANGSIRVKFVTHDFSQKEGIIYDKILTSIRILISLVVVFDLKTSPDRCWDWFFLTVKLSKRLSMGKNLIDYNKLRELGMKVLTVFLHSLGFTKSIGNHNLYIKIVQNHHVVLGWFVPYKKRNFIGSSD